MVRAMDEPWAAVHFASARHIEREWVASFGGLNCAVVKFTDEARHPLGWRWYVMLRKDSMDPRFEGVEGSQASAMAMAEFVARFMAFAQQPHNGRCKVNLVGALSWKSDGDG